MKAISLTQPWATLIAIGAKRIETRSWSTKYRGPIAIHAAKGMPRDARMFAYHDPAGKALNDAGILLGGNCAALPRGAIVATAILLEVMLTGDWLNYRHVTRTINLGHGRSWIVTPTEIAFGNYEPGRFAWLLDDVRALPVPIACKGALGLWTLPDDVARMVPR